MGVKAAVRKARMSVSEAMTIDGPACEIVSVHTVRVRHDRGQSESWLSSETQPAHDIRASELRVGGVQRMRSSRLSELGA